MLYALNIIDPLSAYLRQGMDKNRINAKFNQKDLNNSAVSLVFLKTDGEKQMISYDGNRCDEYILTQLLSERYMYDIFYTSLYEISKNNINSILEIYTSLKNKQKWGILDLCPLVGNNDGQHLESLLKSVSIISGTSSEFSILQNKLNIESIDEMKNKFKIKYVFEKRGERGATVYFADKIIQSKLRGKGKSCNTTGCGDSFNAGIIMGLMDRKNIMDILQQAIDISEYVAYNGLNFK